MVRDSRCYYEILQNNGKEKEYVKLKNMLQVE